MKKIIKDLAFLLRPWFKENKIFILLYYLVNITLAPFALYLYTTIPQKTFSSIIKDQNVLKAISILIMLALLAIICDLIPRMFQAVFSYKSQMILKKIEETIYNKALKTDQNKIDSSEFYNSYKLVTESFSNKSSETLEHSIRALRSTSGIISMSFLIFLEGGWVLFLVLIFSAIAILTNILWSSLVAKRDMKTVLQRRKIDYVRRLFFDNNYIMDLKSSHNKNFIFNLLAKAFSENAKIYRHFFKKEILVDLTIVLSNIGAITVVPIYVILKYKNEGSLDIGVFSTLLLASTNLRNGLSQFGWWFSQLRSDALYSEKIQVFYTTKSEIEEQQNDKKPSKKPFEVEIKNLYYHYPNNDNFSLQIDNFKIKAGQKIAIVGDNGAGKSTLFKLLLRFYDVEKGCILYDGLNIQDYNVDLLRKRIGIALQKPVIYATSVKENLMVTKDISDNQIKEMLEKFGLNLDLNHLLTKEFSEDGLVLSGGQLQKFALVSVLLENKSLLLLDEPSSALDPITELEVADLIKSISKTTMILIAHKLSIVKDMDYIYVMKAGKIVEEGTHQSLMEQKQYYFEMYTKQKNSF